MKKLIALTLLCGLTLASTVQSTVRFNYKTQSQPQHVKSYITHTLKTKCAAAFDEETIVTVTNVEYVVIDQGMEREYTATVEVVSDYGHSPAQIITIQFDEDVYHGQGFYLYDLDASLESLCE